VPAKPLRDVVAPGLDVLFCGINPSLLSAARGHHFARPGNRFWPALHLAGLTPRRMTPEEDAELPRYGLGVTNLVDRPTRAAAELTPDELREGAAALAELVARYRPRVLAVLGVGAYRAGFGRPRAVLGRQDERVGGAQTWVVPNPSGLNAHYQLPDLARLYRGLRSAACGEGAQLVGGLDGGRGGEDGGEGALLAQPGAGPAARGEGGAETVHDGPPGDQAPTGAGTRGRGAETA
jgi:TDG/mug DNA glycosylase family protein